MPSAIWCCINSLGGQTIWIKYIQKQQTFESIHHVPKQIKSGGTQNIDVLRKLFFRKKRTWKKGKLENTCQNQTRLSYKIFVQCLVWNFIKGNKIYSNEWYTSKYYSRNVYNDAIYCLIIVNVRASYEAYEKYTFNSERL